MKILSYDGLQVLVEKIKELFVQKEVGKGLSTNDYTTVEKDKLKGLKNYVEATAQAPGLMGTNDKKKLDSLTVGAEKNIITQVKRNGTVLSPDVNRSIDIKIPVKLSELTNDSGYQTKSDVQALVNNITKMTKEVVTNLPQSGQDNIIYLKPTEGPQGNVFEEYLWINDKYEKIGDTATTVDLVDYVKKGELNIYAKTGDLSKYVAKSELVNISTEEINAMFV